MMPITILNIIYIDVAADESGDQTTDLAEFSRIFYDENGNMTKVVFNTLDQKPIEVVEADGRVKNMNTMWNTMGGTI